MKCKGYKCCCRMDCEGTFNLKEKGSAAAKCLQRGRANLSMCEGARARPSFFLSPEDSERHASLSPTEGLAWVWRLQRVAYAPLPWTPQMSQSAWTTRSWIENLKGLILRKVTICFEFVFGGGRSDETLGKRHTEICPRGSFQHSTWSVNGIDVMSNGVSPPSWNERPLKRIILLTFVLIHTSTMTPTADSTNSNLALVCSVILILTGTQMASAFEDDELTGKDRDSDTLTIISLVRVVLAVVHDYIHKCICRCFLLNRKSIHYRLSLHCAATE